MLPLFWLFLLVAASCSSRIRSPQAASLVESREEASSSLTCSLSARMATENGLSATACPGLTAAAVDPNNAEHCSRTNGLRRQVESLAETERVAALHLHIGDENRQLLLRDAEQLRDRVPPSNFERFRVLSQLSALQQLSDAAREVAHPEVRRQLMGRISAVCYTARAVAV